KSRAAGLAAQLHRCGRSSLSARGKGAFISRSKTRACLTARSSPAGRACASPGGAPLARSANMTSFKSYRDRSAHSRMSGEAEASSGPASSHPTGGNGRRRADSTATELGPEHLEILRKIESEGEP